MFPFFHAIDSLVAGSWSALFGNALEWSATILSLVGFYYCILKKPSSFLIFLVADFNWGVSAYLSGHWALVIQQTLYTGMNIAGYIIWKHEQEEEAAWERAYRHLEQQVKQLSARLAEFEVEDDEEEVTPAPPRAASHAGSRGGAVGGITAMLKAIAKTVETDKGPVDGERAVPPPPGLPPWTRATLTPQLETLSVVAMNPAKAV